MVAAERIEGLVARAGSYLKPRQLRLLRKAYEYGAEAHAGQTRLSGGPYIEHPLAVAEILAEMRMDHETLAAAILHDVIEDTGAEKEVLARRFGEGVAELVDGVTKLGRMEFDSYAEAQAENVQKMMMAMARDIRVILLKLADRLHNMRTIEALAPDKRRRIARETLDIYAPIAQRLGMNVIRHELEDLGFRALYPLRYRVLANEIRKARGNRKELVGKIRSSIERRLEQEGIAAQVIGREKHVYSVYRKMRAKQLSFSEVHDVYGFRVIVDSVDTCYRTLGLVHNLYKPVPGKFKDYIAIPKSNGYQSLHTVLFSPYGVPIEVQIRTRHMDEVAEAGIAAHWLYKSASGETDSARRRANEWLHGVLELQRQAGDSREFLENIKVDLFPDEVYVFTPNGDIIELPRGATPVDFAYAIHTDVGNTCVAARVDRRLVPLRTPLHTGQTVEVITAPGGRPNPSWLSFVTTSRARSNIRHYLKHLQRDEARVLGRRMLERELGRFGLSLERIGSRRLRRVLRRLGVDDVDRLCEEIGLGERLAPLVARALLPDKDAERTDAGGPEVAPLLIAGTEGMVVSFPKCCHPIPGDPILGYVSAGRGLAVHHRDCRNVAEFRSQPDKWVDLAWAKDINAEFSAGISLDCLNRRGALASIASVIAEEGANIEELTMNDRDEQYVRFEFVVQVRDRQHLARVIRRLRASEHTTRVARTKV